MSRCRNAARAVRFLAYAVRRVRAGTAASRREGYGIEAGRIPTLPEYLDAERAAENFDSYTRGMGYRLWAVECRAVDDGRIANVWLVEKRGDIAASLLLVIGGAYAVGLGSILG